MGSWNDFNDAQSNTNLIPKGTLAKVRLTIRPGGFDDASQGWTGGYATRGSTGAVYLNGEFLPRERAPATGPVANVADTAADTLDRAGTYLQQQDLADMRADLEGMIRRYPVQSLLIGFGVGYLLARSTRR